MEQTNETRELEIDLGKIFYKMRNRIILVVIVTFIAAIASGLFTHYAIDPIYSATIKMYVYSNTDRIVADSSITTSELSASQDLVNTYIYILESDTVLEAVIDDLNLNVSADALKSSISAKQAENTVAFEVTVNAKGPKTAAKIANSIAKIAPAEIIRVVKAGGVEIIDYAKVPTSPSSPNLVRNVLIATAIAFFASFAGLFIYEMFDTTITNARDLEGEFEFPILGTIPNLVPTENKTNTYSSQFDKVNLRTANNPPDEATVEIKPDEPLLNPSSSILENIQNMKGDGNNE